MSLAAAARRPLYVEAADALLPNPGQLRAYESTGHCVVLAGPGSGKTKTLTVKLAQIVDQCVRQPRKVACITFNNECVLELRRRLAALGIDERRNLFLGTVHSFCFQNVVLPYAKLAGIALPQPVAIASPREQNDLFARAVSQAISVDTDPRDLKSEAHKLRLTVLDRTHPDWNGLDDRYARAIARYEIELREAGFIDFDDMALLGHRLITQHDWVRRALKARFPVMVIDEYQDLGLPLHEMVVSLLTAGVRIVAVGDPNQSIYGFTGAMPHLLESLGTQPGVEVVRLTFNYRCGREIVRTSNVTIPRTTEEEPKASYEGLVQWHMKPAGIRAQADFICETLLTEIRSRNPDTTLGDIAVLYPGKYDGDVIAEAATEAGISYTRIDQNSAYPRTPLTRWLEQCAAWCAGGWALGEPPLSSVIRAWLRLNRSAADQARIRALKRTLVRTLVDSRDAGQPLGAWLRTLEAQVLQDTFIAEPTLRDEREVFDRLKEAVGPSGLLADCTVDHFGAQQGAPHYLNLITLHSSKGREFDAVIVMGLDEGKLPRKGDTVDQERRLFYVGLTRAKHEFHMTYSGAIETRRGNLWTKGPSRFLLEIQQAALRAVLEDPDNDVPF